SLLYKIPRCLKSLLFPYTTLFRSNTDRLVNLTVSRGGSAIPRRRRDWRQDGQARHRRQPVQNQNRADRGPFLNREFEFAVDRKRSEEHTSELQSRENLVCRLLLEK